jgi:Na+/serine symporter
MANQHTTPQTTKRIVRAILIGLALVILVVSLDQSATELSNHLGTFARDAIALLPSLVLTAWQASQASADHPFSLCTLQMLLSLPLLQTVAKAA